MMKVAHFPGELAYAEAGAGSFAGVQNLAAYIYRSTGNTGRLVQSNRNGGMAITFAGNQRHIIVEPFQQRKQKQRPGITIAFEIRQEFKRCTYPVSNITNAAISMALRQIIPNKGIHILPNATRLV